MLSPQRRLQNGRNRAAFKSDRFWIAKITDPSSPNALEETSKKLKEGEARVALVVFQVVRFGIRVVQIIVVALPLDLVFTNGIPSPPILRLLKIYFLD